MKPSDFVLIFFKHMTESEMFMHSEVYLYYVPDSLVNISDRKYLRET
jgi:hypothetical protein